MTTPTSPAPTGRYRHPPIDRSRRRDAARRPRDAPQSLDVKAVESYLPQVLGWRKDLHQPLVRAVDALDPSLFTIDRLSALHEEDEDAYVALTTAVAACYYLSPVVRRADRLSGPSGQNLRSLRIHRVGGRGSARSGCRPRPDLAGGSQDEPGGDFVGLQPRTRGGNTRLGTGSSRGRAGAG